MIQTWIFGDQLIRLQEVCSRSKKLNFFRPTSRSKKNSLCWALELNCTAMTGSICPSGQVLDQPANCFPLWGVSSRPIALARYLFFRPRSFPTASFYSSKCYQITFVGLNVRFNGKDNN